ncbi:MAG: TIGR03619 family F420-dependent LLM class oxidoreductase, partial [Nitrospinota bacterium]
MGESIEVGLILSLTMRGLMIGSYEQMRETAREVEDLGFHSIWLCDHFFTLAPAAYASRAGFGKGRGPADDDAPASLPLLEVWTTLSALSRDTRRLRLGTSMICVSFRFPSVLAKMAATLDVISGGRLELGIGAGWFEQEYRAYGIPFPPASVRVEQLEEAVSILKEMWTKPNPAFQGRHFQIDGALCDPPPVQAPHPPIRIGGEGKKVLRVAARHAQGFNARWWPPGKFTERTPEIEAACREFGRDPAELRRSLMAILIPERDPAAAGAERRNYAAVPDSGLLAGGPA